MDRKQLGKLGEEIAEKYLRGKGYKILDRNFSKRFTSGYFKGEIDLIVKKDNLISFVEVKTLWQNPLKLGQNKDNPFFPEQKVNFKKIRKVAKMAEIWLQNQKIPLNTEWGIDVISIIINSKGAKIKHFKNIS